MMNSMNAPALQQGNVVAAEMACTFNLGVGMALVVSQGHQDRVIEMLEESGVKAWRIGMVTQTQGELKM